MRCCLVQVGNRNALWPFAVQYAAAAMAFEVWSAIHRCEFSGLRYPFGALVHYRPNLRKSKLGSKTRPGLFLGWRIDAGVNWKGVYKIVDLEVIRSWISGKGSLSTTTSMTVVSHKEGVHFPLREAVQKQLEQLEDLPRLFADSTTEEDIKAIDNPGVWKRQDRMSLDNVPRRSL